MLKNAMVTASTISELLRENNFFLIPALGWRWGSGLTGFQPLSHMTLFTCGHLSSYDKLKTLSLLPQNLWPKTIKNRGLVRGSWPLDHFNC